VIKRREGGPPTYGAEKATATTRKRHEKGRESAKISLSKSRTARTGGVRGCGGKLETGHGRAKRAGRSPEAPASPPGPRVDGGKKGEGDGGEDAYRGNRRGQGSTKTEKRRKNPTSTTNGIVKGKRKLRRPDHILASPHEGGYHGESKEVSCFRGWMPGKEKGESSRKQRKKSRIHGTW